MPDKLSMPARIHQLRVESTGDLVGIPDRFADLEWLALHLHDLVTNPGAVRSISPEALARIRDHKPVMEMMVLPRDLEADHDKLSGSVSDLHRQLRGIRDRLRSIENQPIDVADQLTTLDQRMTDTEKRIETVLAFAGSDPIARLEQAHERIDNIEKHCEAMDGRIAEVMSLLGMGKIQPASPHLPEIDPNRMYPTRGALIFVSNLRRVQGGDFLRGIYHVCAGGIEYQWHADGRLLPGRDSPEDVLIEPRRERMRDVIERMRDEKRE